MAAKLPSLTGLRFVAATAVLVSHLSENTTGHVHDVLDFVGRDGRDGVAFFFMLSGFVLTWSRRPGESDRFFWRKRFARIYPAYLASILLGCLVGWHEAGRVPLGVLLACLLLVQDWIPVQNWYLGIDGPAWSLSAEAFFYALAPFLMRLLPKRATQLWIVLICVCSLLMVTDQFLFLYHAQSDHGVYVGYYFPVTRLLDFVIGVVLARLCAHGRLPSLNLKLVLLVTSTAYLLAHFAERWVWDEVVMLVPLMAVIIAAAQTDISGRLSRLGHPRWVYLGEISYCLYLLHTLVFRGVATIVKGAPYAGFSALAFVTVTVPLSLAAAAALHRIVEKPMEARLRGDGRVSLSDGQ